MLEIGDGYRTLTDYTYEQVADNTTELGVKDTFSFVLDAKGEQGQSLMFHTVHEQVEVYVNGELVLSKKPEYAIGKTPGNFWVSIPLVEDGIKEITVCMIPVYKASVGSVPTFYLGTQSGVFISVFRRQFIPAFVAVALLVLGIVFIGYSIYTGRSVNKNRNLVTLGIFAINLGAWKISDLVSLDIIFPDSRLLAYLPLMFLMFLTVPFLWFLKDRFHNPNEPIWHILCLASMIAIVCSAVLQLMNVADLRETIVLHHMIMVCSMFVVAFMTAREVIRFGFNTKNKVTLACSSICMAGLIFDMVSFYITKGQNEYLFSMIAFFGYTLLSGVIYFKDTEALLHRGIKAEEYKKKAYVDQLTGVYNRTAFADHTARDDFKKEGCVLVMMDLNGLKSCNDNHGHYKGDKYLIESTKIIKKVFGDECYRMGGDEFCVILHDISDLSCAKLITDLESSVYEWNLREKEVFCMGIASGFKRYDAKKDFNVEDTLRRADRVMYRKKYAMKKTKVWE